MNFAYGTKSYSISSLTIAFILALFALIPTFFVAPTYAAAALSPANTVYICTPQPCGPNGATVKVTGSGFNPGDTVSFTVDTSTLGLAISGVTTVAALPSTSTNPGGFTVTLTIGYLGSAIPSGGHTIQAIDQHGNTASFTFTTTTPSIGVSTTSACTPGTSATTAPGASVTICGSGFIASATILTVKAFGTEVGQDAVGTNFPTSFWATVLSVNGLSSTGTFTGTVQLPQLATPSSTSTTAASSGTITVTDSRSNSASSTATITAASITPSASTGLVAGQLVTVTGSGFGPLTTFTVSLISGSSAVGGVAATAVTPLSGTSTTTTASGTLAFAFQVPSGLQQGTYTLKVKGGYNNMGTSPVTIGPSVQFQLGATTSSLLTSATNLQFASGAAVAPAAGIPAGLDMGFQIIGTGFPGATFASTQSGSITFSSNLVSANPTFSPGTIFCVSGCIAGSGTTFAVDVSTTFTAVGYFGAATALAAQTYTATVTVGTVSASPVTFSGVGSPSSTVFTAVSIGNVGSSSLSSVNYGSSVNFEYWSSLASASYVVTPSVTLDGVTVFTGSPVTGTTTWPTTLTVTVPLPTSTTAGSHSLQLVMSADNTGNTNTVSVVTGAATLTASPTSDPIGGTVSFWGTGYAEGVVRATAGLSATLSGATQSLTLGSELTVTTFTSATGFLAGSFALPNSAALTYTLALQDNTGAPFNTASTSVTIAAPSISLAVTTGPESNALTITGSGFAENSQGSPITIKIGSNQFVIAAGLFSGTSTLTGRANPSGSLLLETTLPINQLFFLTGGAQTVTVADSAGNTATATYTITPEISASPSAAGAGAYVTLSGDGFGASKSLTVTLGGSAVTVIDHGVTPITTATTVKSLPNGQLTTTSCDSGSSCDFLVPASAVTSTLSVSDGVNPAATLSFTVLPASAIILTPSSGPTSTYITITAVGFTPAASVASVKFKDSAGTTTTLAVGGTTTIQSDGTLNAVPSGGTNGATVTLPSTAAGGAATVTLTDSAGITASATFTVTTASVTINGAATATVATYCSSITVAGSGFSSAATAVLQGTGSNPDGTTGTTAFPITGGVGATSSTGATSFSTTFSGITRPAGTYTLTVTDAQGHSASASLTVTPCIKTPSPSTGLKGASVTVSGGGFAASSSLSLLFGGTLLSWTAGGTTGTDGSIAAGSKITVPITATVGANTVTVTDSVNTAPAATFTVQAPSISLSTTTGAAGSGVTITGGFPTAFTANSAIIIAFDGATLTTTPATFTTNTVSGTFVVSITIPSSAAAGTHTITATDNSNNVASATFTVPSVSGLSTSTFSGSSSSVAETTLGTFKTISASWTNSGSSSITVVMFAVLSGTSGTYVLSGSAAIAAGTTASVYDVLSGVPTGTYSISVTLIASNGVTVSTTYTATSVTVS